MPKEIINIKNNLCDTSKDNNNLTDTKPLINIYLINNINEDTLSTIKSIKNQSFIEWNLKVIYDNDCDKSLLDSILNLDNRIKVVKKENVDDSVLCSNDTKYSLIIKENYILDNTFLECAYWNTMINEDALMIYSNVAEYKDNQDSDFQECNQLQNFIPQCYFIKNSLIDTKMINMDNEKAWEEYISNNEIHILKMNYYGLYLKCKNESKQETNTELVKKITDREEKYPIYKNINYNTYPYVPSWNYKIESVQDEKIKLLFILPWFQVGGADKFNLDLISNLDSDKYDITIITTEKCDYIWRAKFENYAKVYDLTSFLEKKDWASFLYQIVNNKKIDIIFQSNSFYGYYVLPWIKSKFPQVHIVDYLHAETWDWRNGGYPKDSNAIANIVDKTYTCSENLKKVMMNQMNRINDNIETVYIGVDTDKFDESKVKIEDYPILNKDMDTYKDKKIILFCCRLSAEKRPVLAIKIFNEVYKENKDTMMFIVGPGDKREECEKLVQSLSLEDKVIFFGSQDDVRPFYKLATVELICSLEEGITLTTYEALSMKTPVVSANVGGQKELIDEKCGRLVNNIQLPQNIDEECTEEEINRYKKAIIEVLNIDNYENMREYSREKILKKCSLKNMLVKMNEEFVNLKNDKSARTNLVDEAFASQYLVMFNQMDQRNIGEQIKFINDENKRLTDENNELKEYNSNLTTELNNIYNSRRWKYSSVISNILKKKK